MTVNVQLFAGARELAGADSLEVEVDDGANYQQLAAAIAAVCPALETLMTASRFAAGAEYARPADEVDPAAEIALIPPVSGG